MTDGWNRCAGPFKSTHALMIKRLSAQILFFRSQDLTCNLFDSSLLLPGGTSLTHNSYRFVTAGPCTADLIKAK